MESTHLATIPATHQHIIKASTIEQDYLISVALPRHYENRPDQTYPVIYVLDGNWHFGMVVDMVRISSVRMLSFCNELPDAIIIGIGYSNGKTLAEQFSQVCQRRMRDFTPIKDQRSEDWHRSTIPIAEHIESGGAGAFLQFLKDELMPRVETEYRVDPTNRCMLGHSLGGRFALHTIFNYPELFQKYVIVSPFGYDNDPWVKKGATRLPVRMYLAIDEAELKSDANNLARFSRLAQLLRDNLSSDTGLVEQVFPNNTHCGVVAPAYQAGLVAVLP